MFLLLLIFLIMVYYGVIFVRLVSDDYYGERSKFYTDLIPFKLWIITIKQKFHNTKEDN